MSTLDALPVVVSGGVGSTKSLYDILKEAYGDNVNQIQSVNIGVSNVFGSFWDPAHPATTSVLGAAGNTLAGNNNPINFADFKNVQVVVGNNINTNIWMTVNENVGNSFVGRTLGVTALQTNLDMPNAADHIPTAADVVKAAHQLATAENNVANSNDCHGIASAIAASAGATLDPNSGSTGKAGETPNEAGGFWRIAFENGSAGSDWQSKVQPGDIVRMERTDGGVHTVTVTGALNPADGKITVVDNFNGKISEHAWDYDNDTKANTVTIYRIAADGKYLIDESKEAGAHNIVGTEFNDDIRAGNGADTLRGGKGSDSLDGGNGDDTAVFTGKQSDYEVTKVDATTAILKDLRAGSPDGTDKIMHIEHVKFADGTVDFANLKTAPAPAPTPAAGSVSINDVQIIEGNNGQQFATFTVTRTGGDGSAFDVNFATKDGSATVADGDYAEKHGTVHFNAGVNTQTVTVAINGDTKLEGNETFNVNLSGPTNGATIAKAQGVGNIMNDDAAPVAGSVTINDVQITEGNNGSQFATFTVARTGGNAAFDVNFATADGSATTADGDYVAKSGKVHFDAGVNSQTVTVEIKGDTKIEANESFNVNLSGATNGATIAKTQGVGNIMNDDSAPVAGSVAINDVQITEGDNGSKFATFTVTRSGGNAAFDVNFATADGSATTADGDYVAKSGKVHFDAGVNTQTVTVAINGDTKVEASENFKVNLSGATNGATISDTQGIGVIGNDDAAKVAGSISISDATITEGNNGTHIETFTVTRTGGSAAFDVHYATAAGTASGADGDYVAKGGDLHFAEGVNSQTISIVVNGDTKVEATETFKVNLSAATNGATIADGQGIGTIVNDDKAAATHHVDNDFTGDGISDALFMNSKGQVALWQLDGNHIAANTTITGAGAIGSDWHAAGTGDFNGDGITDVLWQNSKGQVAMWQMDGDHVASNTLVSGAGAVGSDWKIVGTEDFNGDGKADVLWQNAKGQVAMWQMDGDHVASNTLVSGAGAVGSDWKVIGSDDFNGDGKADVLWQNGKGQVAMWQMDGDHVASNALVTGAGAVSSDWHAAGTGDFDGDGKADVLWQNSKGQVAMWQMDGNHVDSNTIVGSAAGWKVVDTGDYNHDGKADVLFENASGKVAQWQMDGDHIDHNLTVGSHSIDWHMV